MPKKNEVMMRKVLFLTLLLILVLFSINVVFKENSLPDKQLVGKALDIVNDARNFLGSYDTSPEKCIQTINSICKDDCQDIWKERRERCLIKAIEISEEGGGISASFDGFVDYSISQNCYHYAEDPYEECEKEYFEKISFGDEQCGNTTPMTCLFSGTEENNNLVDKWELTHNWKEMWLDTDGKGCLTSEKEQGVCLGGTCTGCDGCNLEEEFEWRGTGSFRNMIACCSKENEEGSRIEGFPLCNMKCSTFENPVEEGGLYTCRGSKMYKKVHVCCEDKSQCRRTTGSDFGGMPFCAPECDEEEKCWGEKYYEGYYVCCKEDCNINLDIGLPYCISEEDDTAQ